MNHRLVCWMLMTGSLGLIAPVLADEAELKVGQRAPSLDAVAADGNALLPEQLAGKIVLMTFWSDETSAASHFAKLREIRREFSSVKGFQMVSVRLEGEFDEWLRFLEKQPALDEQSSDAPFYSDAKWWQMFHFPAVASHTNPFKVGKQPRSFLIGADGRLVAVDLSDKDVRDAVSMALKKP
jgi:hypothetical protein